MKRRHLEMVNFFMRSYRWRYAWIGLLILVTSVLESFNLIAFFPVLSSLLGTPIAPNLIGHLHVFGGLMRRLPPSTQIVSAVVLLFAIMVAKALFIVFREWLIASTSGTVMHQVKTRLMAWYAQAPYDFLLETKQGALTNITLIAPQRVGLLLLRVPQVIAEFLKLLAIVIVLFLVWPAAALLLGGIGLAYNWLTQTLGKRISYNVGTGRVTAWTEQASILNEFLNGARHIKAFCVQHAWVGRFERVSRSYRTLYIKDLFWLIVPNNIMEVTAVALLLGAILVSQIPGSPFQASLSVLGLFAVALVRLLPSLNAFGRMRMEMLGTLPESERIYQVLTQPVTARREGGLAFTALREHLVLEEVSFTHKGREELLHRLNLVIRKGRLTAVVGPSGSGKSTLVNLLIGFLEPTKGRILIDGRPLSEYQLATWRAKVGVVSQDPFIYHASIADNILFDRSGYGREDLIRAAQRANAHEFITALPHGYDTMVGERGMKLSGGQQQRVAIARAMLGDPEVLIFDEATSHLDAVAERQVQEAIEQVSKDRTVIVIAHRLSTVKDADIIVVLDEGRIVETGRHDTLVRERGRYFDLVSSGESAG